MSINEPWILANSGEFARGWSGFLFFDVSLSPGKRYIVLMKIALGQFNPIVGDIEGNTERIAEFIQQSAKGGANLIVFGELSLVGYPPRDLLRKDGFAAASVAAVEKLAPLADGIAVLVGFVRPTPGDAGRPLQNCAALLADGQIKHVHVKSLLPTYDVFDETRYFEPSPESKCVEVAGVKIGISICEDIWDSDALGRELYGGDPVGRLIENGAEVIINMAASPFEMGKAKRREELFLRQAARTKGGLVYVNQVGGNDELIFDGCSCVVRPDGKILGRAKAFTEDLLIVDMDAAEPARCEPFESEMETLNQALQLGIGDYVRKCGFSSVVLGMSGGIDSAVVGVLAADALGGKNVHVIAMPSRYSSDHSLTDAEALARNCGMDYRVIPIEDIHAAFESATGELLSDAGAAGELAGENIQARIRGSLVMGWSNAGGHLPLATGNKSELSVGYCTLYGDMCGGLAPIGDVLKMQVYALAEHINKKAGADRIPRNIITKAPSAELKPGQVDQDKLPPYEVLDEILRQYVELDRAAHEIIENGFSSPEQVELVHRVLRMVDVSEFKRQQAARVLKVSSRAFGIGRRVPIAQRFVQRRK